MLLRTTKEAQGHELHLPGHERVPRSAPDRYPEAAGAAGGRRCASDDRVRQGPEAPAAGGDRRKAAARALQRGDRTAGRAAIRERVVVVPSTWRRLTAG